MAYSITGCTLSSGYELAGCAKNNVGGLAKIYLGNFEDANDTIIYDDITGTYTGVTTGCTWYTFDTVKATSNFTESITANPQNGTLAFVPTITMVINKLETANRNLIHMLALSLVVAVALDNNGRYWVIGGDKGLDVTAVEMGSGTELGDRNGATITLAGGESYPMAELDPDKVATFLGYTSYGA